MQTTKFEPQTSYIDFWKEIPEEIRWSKDDFQKVWDAKPEEHGKVKMYGKELDVPRWQKTYLHNYKFSGMQHQASPESEVPEPVLKLLKWVQKQDSSVNGILINWYKNGLHYIGYHADSESDLIKQSKIWSFSFGQERELYLKSIKDKTVDKFPMPDNSLIVMCGTLQQTHKHSVPKITGNKGEKLGPRINVTFRSFKS